GLDTAGLTLRDGSGLARANRVSPRLLTTLLSRAADPDEPRLRRLLSALPVAGFTGTLAHRYDAPPAIRGAGLVRAKTGTLLKVSALAGTVLDADGRLLAFALLAEASPDVLAAERVLDRAATALARCGCR
ncbi:MAG: D-alanyl-D-alanine carboxypeptidase, partial [Actinomycetota bacterium]|nr:D-alanyl-D-alanine carboxypeptidase [Actinomycetota bacterium]